MNKGDVNKNGILLNLRVGNPEINQRPVDVVPPMGKKRKRKEKGLVGTGCRRHLTAHFTVTPFRP